MPIPTTAARRIPATGKKEFRLIRKAGKPDQIAVYDQAGNLLGTVGVDALQPLAQPDGGKTADQKKIDAQAAKVQAQHAPPDPTAPDTVVADVTKSVVQILKGVPARPANEVRKAATSLDGQFKALLAAAGPERAQQLQSLTANSALKMMTSGRPVNGARAVTIAKRAVCQVAVNRRVI